MTVILDSTIKSLEALCTQEAAYLGTRLASRMPAGVLSLRKKMDTDDWTVPLCYIDAGQAVAVAVVSVEYPGVMYFNGAVAVQALGPCIGPQQAQEFAPVTDPVYFFDLKLVEYYGEAGGPPPPPKPEPAITPELSPYAVAKATWDTAYVNGLPDSAFLLVESGGEKDADGKTKPRSLRHFPYKDDSGKVDLPHLRNAIAQMPKAKIEGFDQAKMDALQERARGILAKEEEPSKKSRPHLSRIAKASKSDIDPEWMYVLSVVLEPNDGADGAKREPDFDNEIYDRYFIRKVAFPYVRKYRGLGIMHNGQRLNEDVARVVQSYVVDDGFSLTDDKGNVWGPGTWFLGSEVKRDSDLGKKIESGELGAYSIDGMALKAPESEVA